jgi:hypothetical protein
VTVSRGLFLLIVFGMLAVAVVLVRSEKTRMSARIAALRRESWTLQMQYARLRTPDQIRQRLGYLDLQVRAPHDKSPIRQPSHLAAR